MQNGQEVSREHKWIIGSHWNAIFRSLGPPENMGISPVFMTTHYVLSSAVLPSHHITKRKKSISPYSETLDQRLSPRFHAPRQLLPVTESINCPPLIPPIGPFTAHYWTPRINTIHVVPGCGPSPNTNYTLSGYPSMGWSPCSRHWGGRSQHGDHCPRARRAAAICPSAPMIAFLGSNTLYNSFQITILLHFHFWLSHAKLSSIWIMILKQSDDYLLNNQVTFIHPDLMTATVVESTSINGQWYALHS